MKKTKKLFSLILAIVLLCSALPMGVFNITASAADDGYYTYTVSNGKASVIGCDTTISGDITIPSTLGGYPVTSIGVSAFVDCESLTSIIIPDSVTSIFRWAFEGCTSLRNLAIPDSVTSIGDYAFSNCTSLNSIKLPDSVTSIGIGAFYNCTNLESITLPFVGSSRTANNSYNAVFGYIFGCTENSNTNGTTYQYYSRRLNGLVYYYYYIPLSLKSVTITDTPQIPCHAFYNCENVISIKISDSVTNIGDYAFHNCSSLSKVYYRGNEAQKENINIANSNSNLTNANWYYSICDSLNVHSYDYDCEERCNICEYKRIPLSVHIYNNNSDTSCNICGELRTITHNYEWIIDKQENCGIDGYKHEECTVCHKVQNENTIISATGNHDFKWTIDKKETCVDDGYKHEECTVCHKVQNENTVIPATQIHTYASDCDNKCNVCSEVREVSAKHIYHNDYSNAVPCDIDCNLCGAIRYLEYNIENDYVTITGCDTSFIGKMKIPEIIEGFTVKYISNNAFKDCISLSELTMPDTILEIGESAFAGCYNMSDIKISEAVEIIGESAFAGCEYLEEIVIPDSVNTIGCKVFDGCESLTKITLPFIGKTFDGTTENDNDENTFWHLFGTYILPDSLTDVVITKAEKLGESAFWGCDGLNLTLPNTLKSIGENAFQPIGGGYNYLSLNIFVSNIDNWFNINFEGDYSNPINGHSVLFLNGSRYTNHKINADTQRIKELEYENYSFIENLYIPKSVLAILKDAFLGCDGLKYVFYEGTEAEWNQILVANGNNVLKEAQVFFNCDDIYECYISGHSGGNATCKNKAICSCCKKEYGKLADHKSDSGTVTKKATCSAIGTKTYKCTVCKKVLKTETLSMLTHNYLSATCTKAKTCKVCGVTSGKALGHTYTNACDEKCNVCGATRKITHSYKTTTTKATLSKDGKTVKKCTVCDKVASTKKISYPKTIKLSTTSYTYNGKAKKPSVTVKDSSGKKLTEDKDYTVTYPSGRKKVGSYKVKVKFKGNYSGTEYLTFKINPKATKVSSVSADKKSLKVKIKKQSSQTSGYEIQCSTSNKFSSAKTKKVTSNKTTSVTLKSLKAKKTYYIRVRTYKTVNGKKYYSAWSSYKYKKTK